MGAPKKKWSQEEEDALTAGIARYGAGKWSAILNDPDYQTVLSARTNVDLKDKYRNIKAMEKGVGHRQRGMGVPKVKSAPKNQAAATSRAIVKYVAKPAKPSKLQPKKNSVASTSGPALVVKPPEGLKNNMQIDPQSADMEIVQVDSPKGGNKHALVKFEVDDELQPPVEVVKHAMVKHENDYIQKKLVDMTAEEADVAAAVAVAEAEAAREWAERAGREADAVEREAEAARNFADSMSSVDYMEFFLIKY